MMGVEGKASMEGAKEGQWNSREALGFYVAASDRDLVQQITEMFGRKGYVGVADGAGRVRYLVDGRDGPATAAGRILRTAEEALRQKSEFDDRLMPYASAAITAVLDESRIDSGLKGHRYLRFMLSLTFRDDSLLRPITKTLYPAVAERFRTRTEHVERDVRYAIRRSDFQPRGVSGSKAVCLLHDRVMMQAEAMYKQERQLSS